MSRRPQREASTTLEPLATGARAMLRIKSLSSNLITPRVSCHVCSGGVCVHSLSNADIYIILSIHSYIIACDVTLHSLIVITSRKTSIWISTSTTDYRCHSLATRHTRSFGRYDRCLFSILKIASMSPPQPPASPPRASVLVKKFEKNRCGDKWDHWHWAEAHARNGV